MSQHSDILHGHSSLDCDRPVADRQNAEHRLEKRLLLPVSRGCPNPSIANLAVLYPPNPVPQ
jgi:hypothetical protein